MAKLALFIVLLVACCTVSWAIKDEAIVAARCEDYKDAYTKLMRVRWKCNTNNPNFPNNPKYLCAVNPHEADCTVKCIDEVKVCDGTAQCPLGDDELNCPPS